MLRSSPPPNAIAAGQAFSTNEEELWMKLYKKKSPILVRTMPPDCCAPSGTFTRPSKKQKLFGAVWWFEACLVQAQTENLSPIQPSCCTQEEEGNLKKKKKQLELDRQEASSSRLAYPMPDLCVMSCA